VSVPEKTLEHWSSQYITYRFRSLAAQWWPASGEDIDVRWLPARPGKAVQLELKTTTVARPGVHDVIVDLGQLWEYRQRPLGRQPFYAFPRPDSAWEGKLTAAALAHGRAITEIGFARSGPGWWFADWMVVLTAAQVAAVLDKELAAHGSKRRKKPERLVRFDRSSSEPVWGNGTTAPSLVGWRDYWTILQSCGRSGWPQLIRLPVWLVQTGVPYSHSDLGALFREAATYSGATSQAGTDEPLVTLEPYADGTYQVTPTLADIVSVPEEDAIDDEDGSDQTSDYRQVAFLDARALQAKQNW